MAISFRGSTSLCSILLKIMVRALTVIGSAAVRVTERRINYLCGGCGTGLLRQILEDKESERIRPSPVDICVTADRLTGNDMCHLPTRWS